MKPEEFFVMLQDCSLEILPWISNASWKQFTDTHYNDDAVKCLLRKYYCPDENVALSAHPYWKKIGTKFYADRNSLSQDLSLEDEIFLLVFIKYCCKEYFRFKDIICFLIGKPFLSKSTRENILTHFSGLQDQSYFRFRKFVDFLNCKSLFSRSLRRNILARFHEMQDQSYLGSWLS